MIVWPVLDAAVTAPACTTTTVTGRINVVLIDLTIDGMVILTG